MNRLPESVTQKFNELFAVIGKAGDDLKIATAEASIAGNFSEATSNIEDCQRLLELEKMIKSYLSNFESENKPGIRDKNYLKRVKRRSRKPRGQLRVRLADRIIEKPTIAETFVETLKVFGLERVARLNKMMASIPLVARHPTQGYQTQRPCNGWFITTHVNTLSATNALKEIGQELNIPVKIEFVER